MIKILLVFCLSLAPILAQQPKKQPAERPAKVETLTPDEELFAGTVELALVVGAHALTNAINQVYAQLTQEGADWKRGYAAMLRFTAVNMLVAYQRHSSKRKTTKQEFSDALSAALRDEGNGAAVQRWESFLKSRLFDDREKPLDLSRPNRSAVAKLFGFGELATKIALGSDGDGATVVIIR